MSMQQYEFSEAENAQIRPLSSKMAVVGMIMIVLGGLTCLGIFAGQFQLLIQGAIFIVIGVWTRKAAAAFRTITETQGNDIPLLMNALGELRKLYTLQFWLFIVMAVLTVIGVVTVVTIGATMGLSD